MIGTKISHYKILEKLGEGGMGVVYKAQDTKLKRLVALKFLSKELTNNVDNVERFINEAQTASALDHANICTIYEINETEKGQFFIAMAYYEGETLKQKLDVEALSAEDVIDIATQIAEGLARAHEANIMHRDIKPENIIITDRGEAKIIDFGIAKLASQNHLTQAGASIGTVAYMSPEQIQGLNLDFRTDIWSLGVTIYEMITGQLPFEGDYHQAIMYAIINEQPMELQEFRSDLSPNLQLVVDLALTKNVENRYQTIRDMIIDLQGKGEPSQESYPEVLVADHPKNNYLPDYQNDVFVSYAYIDNKSLSKGQKGWIDNFHNALEIRLEQLLGADTKIWRDDNLTEKMRTGDKNSTSIPQTAILIAMISPQYIKSKKCLEEVKEFYKALEQNEELWINDRARIFKAVKTYVPRESQPEELQSIPDYEFFRFDPNTGRPQEFWPELGAEANRNFWVKLEDIAYDIYQLLETLKTQKPGTIQSKSADKQSIVYIAETTYDLTGFRDRIKRQLQQHGYLILPDKPLPLNVDDIQNRIHTDLDRCSISIHLVGKNYGVVPEGEKRSIPEIQHQLAIDRSQVKDFSRLIWMPPEVHPQDERQHKFVESMQMESSIQHGADLLQTSFGEFMIFLKDKLIAKPVDSQKQEPKNNIQYIYLQCDQKDIDATADLEEYLFDKGFEIKLPAFEGDESEVFEAHKENLLLCDGTIIYYGDANDSWLSAKMADLQKIAGYGRSNPIRAKAIYLAAPETKHKQRFRTREALAIKNFDTFSPEMLAPFLDAMKNGKGENQ